MVIKKDAYCELITCDLFLSQNQQPFILLFQRVPWKGILRASFKCFSIVTMSYDFIALE